MPSSPPACLWSSSSCGRVHMGGKFQQLRPDGGLRHPDEPLVSFTLLPCSALLPRSSHPTAHASQGRLGIPRNRLALRDAHGAAASPRDDGRVRLVILSTIPSPKLGVNLVPTIRETRSAITPEGCTRADRQGHHGDRGGWHAFPAWCITSPSSARIMAARQDRAIYAAPYFGSKNLKNRATASSSMKRARSILRSIPTCERRCPTCRRLCDRRTATFQVSLGARHRPVGRIQTRSK